MEYASWPTIEGFNSPEEFRQLLDALESLVTKGRIEELGPSINYPGISDRERWFRPVGQQHVWKLTSPDFPLRGSFKPVEAGHDLRSGVRG